MLMGSQPCEPIPTIRDIFGHLSDVINSANRHLDCSRGYGEAGSLKKRMFSYGTELTLFGATALTVVIRIHL